MRVVCISDTHNCNEQIVVPDGDLLIHSGDATVNGTVDEIVEFNRWFGRVAAPPEDLRRGKSRLAFRARRPRRKAAALQKH